MYSEFNFLGFVIKKTKQEKNIIIKLKPYITYTILYVGRKFKQKKNNNNTVCATPKFFLHRKRGMKKKLKQKFYRIYRMIVFILTFHELQNEKAKMKLMALKQQLSTKLNSLD